MSKCKDQLIDLMNRYGKDATVEEVILAELDRLTESNKTQRTELKHLRRKIRKIGKEVK